MPKYQIYITIIIFSLMSVDIYFRTHKLLSNQEIIILIIMLLIFISLSTLILNKTISYLEGDNNDK